MGNPNRVEALTPVPARKGLFTGTICESQDNAPVTSGSKLSVGTFSVEKGKLAPAVPRPMPPPAVFSRSVSEPNVIARHFNVQTVLQGQFNGVLQADLELSVMNELFNSWGICKTGRRNIHSGIRRNQV